MALSPGIRLGAYDIVALIGAGGMGEVYRARDTKLNRDVAIKVLPDSLPSDPERLARFSREAQVLAALNHPNIAHIHGFEDSTGAPALVMELVEGPTLADRIARGQIPVDEALPIARQIADALEAAHEQGIIHRDLKPANIKVRDDGAVKVLDFGLAKALEPFVSGAVAGVTQSPTIMTPAMTAGGVLLGTAAYMSPEQARGKAVDARADIWAFGCVLFEMLTGRQAFGGETVSDSIANVLGKDLDWNALPASTPVAIRQLLSRCLKRDPKRRLHHIADARLELEEASADPLEVSHAAPPVSKSSRWLGAVPWMLAALALGIAAVTFLSRLDRSSPQPKPVVRLELALPEGVQLYSTSGQTLAISPDGTTVAFVGAKSAERQAYVRRLDRDEATTIGSISSAPGSIAMSPDGLSVALTHNDGALRRASLKDGLFANVIDRVSTSSIAWGTDRIVFGREGTLWQVLASGGAAKQITTPDKDQHEIAQALPMVMPGSAILLFSC